jgi:hypothetical protein
MLPRLVHAIIVVKKDILPENAQVLLRYFSRYVYMVVKMIIYLSFLLSVISLCDLYHNFCMDLSFQNHLVCFFFNFIFVVLKLTTKA